MIHPPPYPSPSRPVLSDAAGGVEGGEGTYTITPSPWKGEGRGGGGATRMALALTP
jgi:hypothetical protein